MALDETKYKIVNLQTTGLANFSSRELVRIKEFNKVFNSATKAELYDANDDGLFGDQEHLKLTNSDGTQVLIYNTKKGDNVYDVIKKYKETNLFNTELAKFQPNRYWNHKSGAHHNFIMFNVKPIQAADSKQKYILIDPGHNVRNPGTCPHVNGKQYIEYIVTKKAADLLANILVNKNKGYKVRLLNQDLDNDARRSTKIEEAPDLMLSLHCDGSDNPEVNGESVIYRSDESAAFAKIIFDSLKAETTIATLHNRENPYQRGENDPNKLKVQSDDPEKTHSVLVELGYLSNPKDNEILTDPDKLTPILEALSIGIDNCFQKKDKSPTDKKLGT